MFSLHRIVLGTSSFTAEMTGLNGKSANHSSDEISWFLQQFCDRNRIESSVSDRSQKSRKKVFKIFWASDSWKNFFQHFVQNLQSNISSILVEPFFLKKKSLKQFWTTTEKKEIIIKTRIANQTHFWSFFCPEIFSDNSSNFFIFERNRVMLSFCQIGFSKFELDSKTSKFFSPSSSAIAISIKNGQMNKLLFSRLKLQQWRSISQSWMVSTSVLSTNNNNVAFSSLLKDHQFFMITHTNSFFWNHQIKSILDPKLLLWVWKRSIVIESPQISKGFLLFCLQVFFRNFLAFSVSVESDTHLFDFLKTKNWIFFGNYWKRREILQTCWIDKFDCAPETRHIQCTIQSKWIMDYRYSLILSTVSWQ